MPLRRKLYAGRVVARSMIKHFERPDRLPRALLAMAPWGQSVAGLVAGAAARYPERIAVYDDAGSITYQEIWHRSQAIAAGLVAKGVGPGVGVGLLARNHRGFIEAMTAVAATGADLVLLNTGFAAPQLADVVEHEHIDVVIHDDDFAAIVEGCGAGTSSTSGDRGDVALRFDPPGSRARSDRDPRRRAPPAARRAPPDAATPAASKASPPCSSGFRCGSTTRR